MIVAEMKNIQIKKRTMLIYSLDINPLVLFK